MHLWIYYGLIKVESVLFWAMVSRIYNLLCWIDVPRMLDDSKLSYLVDMVLNEERFTRSPKARLLLLGRLCANYAKDVQYVWLCIGTLKLSG